MLTHRGPPRASAGSGADHFPGPSTSPPFPLLFPPFPFPTLPTLSPSPPPSPPFPSIPSLPLEVSPLNPARGLGERCKLPPARSGVELQPKLNLMHFSLKIWHLVATILMIFLRINWPHIVQFKPAGSCLRSQAVTITLNDWENIIASTGWA